jgi:hypothetical protein
MHEEPSFAADVVIFPALAAAAAAAVVPEPAMLAPLSLLGAIGIAARRRRRAT